jgi:DNA polymerase-3 subunit epsilon
MRHKMALGNRMREIVLDVETTGLWLNAGHRVIEIACIELEKYMPTGKIFHRYVNPLMGRMPQEAFEIHGIPIEFLWHHAPFHIIADDFLEFIGSDQLVIHNSAFDLAFINNELRLINRPPLTSPTLDTLAMARKLYQGASNSLDALCRRFGIDLSSRSYHGAAVDCALLATVYLEFIGGRQPLFALPAIVTPPADAIAHAARPPRPHVPLTTAEEANFETTMSQIRNPIWKVGSGGTIEELDDDLPF